VNLLTDMNPWAVSLLIGLLLLLLGLIAPPSAPGRKPIQAPCRLHLWEVRQRRYICGRCGLVPGQHEPELDHQ